MNDFMHIEIEQEEDGRWIAEVPDLPGCAAYGPTPEDARSQVEDLAAKTQRDFEIAVRGLSDAELQPLEELRRDPSSPA